jgi:hypothetical protein
MPGKMYNVAVRYANEPVFLQPDQEPGSRGMGLRMFGVEGERLPGADQDATTKDFFFNNAPMIELTDIDTWLEIMELREKCFDSLTKLAAATSKQKAPGETDNCTSYVLQADSPRCAAKHEHNQSFILHTERVQVR